VYPPGCTASPGAWVTQRACRLAWTLQEQPRDSFLIRDRDKEVQTDFDVIFASEGIRILKTPVRRWQRNR